MIGTNLSSSLATSVGSGLSSTPSAGGPTLVLNLDTELGVTQDGSGSHFMSAWADTVSGFGTTVVQTIADANRPQWTADVIVVGDHSATSPLASTKWMHKASGLAGFPAGAKPRIYIVARWRPTGSFTSTFLEIGPGSDVVGSGISIGHNGTNMVVVLALASGTRTITYNDSAEDSFKLYDVRINDNDTSDLLINNSVVASAAASAGGLATTLNQLVLGALADKTATFQGDLMQMEIWLNSTAEHHAERIAYFDARYPSLGL